jgi:hypothetical protein
MIAQTLEHNGKTINIKYDQDGESSRTWDNLGTMACFHNRYNLLGDKHSLSIEEVKDIAENDKDYISLPLYLYDHSGITMNTTGFSCPWDSGQVGVIFVEKSKVRKEYGWKLITQKRKEKILDYLRGEVETYDQYLRGDVFGFEILNSEGEVEDSCWGFFGEEYAIEEAKACA